ncbi:MAG: sorting protein [Nitrosarchaeum sp.]|nr:sorting protein [Nitrosarchaeum sp.]
MQLYILGILLFSLVSSLLLSDVYAESEIDCPNCIQISSYDVELYKQLFPLIVWTDSQIYDHNSIIQVNGYLRPQNSVSPIMAVVTNPIGNVVTVEQFSPDIDGNFSLKLNTQSQLWKQDGDYILKVQSGSDTQLFKTKFTLVSSIIDNADKCNASNEISILANNGRIYCIPFKITKGTVTSAEGKLNLDTKTITLEINGHDIDSIIFDIPRYILDSKSTAGNDSVFIVLYNGKIAEYQELDSDSNSRQIKLNYPIYKKSTFEIVGTNVIPEFGSITILILLVSIMSILIITKSSHVFVKF